MFDGSDFRKNPRFSRPEVALPFPWYIEGPTLPSHKAAPRTARAAVRLSKAEEREIEEAVKARKSVSMLGAGVFIGLYALGFLLLAAVYAVLVLSVLLTVRGALGVRS